MWMIPNTHPGEFHRADVLEYSPDGKFVKIFASGLRNCVGEAINPTTGQLWCSTNERDRLGDIWSPTTSPASRKTASTAGPGTTWACHQDPRLVGKHPELKSKVITPGRDPAAALRLARNDVLHRQAVPFDYSGDGFAAEHGSGIALIAPATRLFESPCMTVKQPECTRTFSPAL